MKRENARDGVCFLCGRDGTEDPLDFHHIFGGNAVAMLALAGAMMLCAAASVAFIKDKPNHNI